MTGRIDNFRILDVNRSISDGRYVSYSVMTAGFLYSRSFFGRNTSGLLVRYEVARSHFDFFAMNFDLRLGAFGIDHLPWRLYSFLLQLFFLQVG
jgi:hypothetical protein